jgi:ribosome-associated translation inhibitor RaiA
MQIQINTDNHIEWNAELARDAEAVIERALKRFARRITRVEVQLTDESSSKKSGGNDKRCVMEARLGGLQPITVSDESPSVRQALGGAADKLEKALTRSLGRLDNPKGRTSFAGDQTD